MLSPRSWSKQEDDEKERILQKFWELRVLSTEEKQREISLSNIKNLFLLALPPQDCSQTEWKRILDEAWNNPDTFKDKKKFFELFDHIHSVTAVGLAEGFIAPPILKNEAVEITDADTTAVQQYTSERKMTASVILGSVKTKVTPCCTQSYTTSDIFNIQSVTKVFTGMLALRMVEEKIISEEDLISAPIRISQTAQKLLKEHAPLVLQQLKTVSLHQALTHFAGLSVGPEVGLGDYYSVYINAIESARRAGRAIPEVRCIEDFIQFMPNCVSAAGLVGQENFHYSNSGFVIAALSLEHLYNARRNIEREPHPLDFNALMKKYVTGPDEAKMSCFTASAAGLHVKFQPELSVMTGSPGGGYYSDAESLKNFAIWIYEKCQKPEFLKLIQNFGQELCPFFQSKTIEHTGDGPGCSAFFSLNWETGNLVIVLNDQRAVAASEIGRAIKNNIMALPADELKSEIGSSTVMIIKSGITPTSPPKKQEIKYPLAKQNNASTTSKMDIVSEEAPDEGSRSVPAKRI